LAGDYLRYLRVGIKCSFCEIGFKKGQNKYGTKSSMQTRIQLKSLLLAILITLSIAGYDTTHASEEQASLWQALQSGDNFALLRHAIAPGSGDPPDFELHQCATQRNLSQEGRDQAKKIGARFRENGIRKAKVSSSQWCRCLETAKLLEIGPVEELDALNSFFQNFGRRDIQTHTLLDWIKAQNLTRPLVLVTHQVNITALTGVYPSSGELVIVHRSKTGGLTVVGTIETQQ
jgi:phosphohistidine phosphatase SixA